MDAPHGLIGVVEVVVEADEDVEGLDVDVDVFVVVVVVVVDVDVEVDVELVADFVVEDDTAVGLEVLVVVDVDALVAGCVGAGVVVVTGVPDMQVLGTLLYMHGVPSGIACRYSQ